MVYDTPLAAPGLRERKKAGLRRELIESALALIEEQGFDATTVRQIADRAEVSTRTFNRYFGSKEDVVLAHEDQLMDDLMAELERRPAGEGPLAALRATIRSLPGHPGWDGPRLERLRRVQALLRDNPPLMGANFARWEQRKERLARHFAERAGTGFGFESRLLASTAFAAIGVALREWAGLPDPDAEACARLIDRALRTINEPRGGQET
ncbi:TetR/AcrR family transcriptional regulator [Actinomadura nitritigenes]|uniref:TetR/AcrR family transcriptional regulator n=1 Tax=Actinomadura nitritigenes TaxID=134602 RepID=UPI003D8D1127